MSLVSDSPQPAFSDCSHSPTQVCFSICSTERLDEEKGRAAIRSKCFEGYLFGRIADVPDGNLFNDPEGDVPIFNYF